MRTGGQSMRYVEEHIARTAARPLSVRQQAVVQFIREELAAERGFPSEQTIRGYFKWKYSGAAKDVLLALAARGLIEQAGWRRVGRRIQAQWRLTEKEHS